MNSFWKLLFVITTTMSLINKKIIDHLFMIFDIIEDTNNIKQWIKWYISNELGIHLEELKIRIENKCGTREEIRHIKGTTGILYRTTYLLFDYIVEHPHFI